jgi:hypothetical protein
VAFRKNKGCSASRHFKFMLKAYQLPMDFAGKLKKCDSMGNIHEAKKIRHSVRRTRMGAYRGSNLVVALFCAIHCNAPSVRTCLCSLGHGDQKPLTKPGYIACLKLQSDSFPRCVRLIEEKTTVLEGVCLTK